jgi:hypothetical protein
MPAVPEDSFPGLRQRYAIGVVVMHPHGAIVCNAASAAGNVT